MEMLKAMKAADDPNFNMAKKMMRSSSKGKDFGNIGEYREALRNQLQNAKVYEEGARVSS